MMTAPGARWLLRRGSCRRALRGRMLVVAAVVCVVLVVAWTRQEALQPFLTQRMGRPAAAGADDTVVLKAASTHSESALPSSAVDEALPAGDDGQELPIIAPAGSATGLLRPAPLAGAAAEGLTGPGDQAPVDSHLPLAGASQAEEEQGDAGQDAADMQWEADEAGAGSEEATDFSDAGFAVADDDDDLISFDDDDDYIDDDDDGRRTSKFEEPASWDERDADSISLDECQAHYGERHFLPEDPKRAPPILYSYPGSGNTWTRYLIDFSTGVYTGTAFYAKSTRGALEGQGKCKKTTSAIKAHPQHFSPQALFSFPESNPHLAQCKRAGHIDAFDRFVLLVRNPYDAIWSEYRRMHGKVVRKHDFDRAAFAKAARKMAALYMDGVVAFRQVRRTLPKEDVFNLKYEDMLDEDMRLSILLRLMNFIGLNDSDSPAERRRRVHCAFLLAEAVGGGRRGSSLLKKLEDDANPAVTSKDAYTPELACDMWSVFGEAAKEIGYSLPEGISCGGSRASGRVRGRRIE